MKKATSGFCAVANILRAAKRGKLKKFAGGLVNHRQWFQVGSAFACYDFIFGELICGAYVAQLTRDARNKILHACKVEGVTVMINDGLQDLDLSAY